LLATYLPEGRFHTLLQPEAMGARLSYALVTLVLMGIGGSALVIRFASRAGGLSAEKVGFRGFGHVATAVVFGVVLGPASYALQGAPSWNRVVRTNAYAQGLVGFKAEILACRAVIGALGQAVLQEIGIKWLSRSPPRGSRARFSASTTLPTASGTVVVLLTVVGL
jgi:hypothetical protein